MTNDDTRPPLWALFSRRDGATSGQVPRPWVLVLLAVASIGAVIAGSIGPWMEYERVSRTAPEVWSDPGWQTDGAFSLVFAAVALLALGVALFRFDGEPFAWVAFAALTLCAVIGLADWLLFAPPERVIPEGSAGTSQQVAWGVKTVGLGGLAGSIATFLIARRLMGGEY